MRKFLYIVDRIYRWFHQLEPVGTIFYVGVTKYKGAPLTLSDGTMVKKGDIICALHFNNERIASIHSEVGRNIVGFSFVRHVIISLAALATKLQRDRAYEMVVALSGTSWFPHKIAKKKGFDIYPVDGLLRLLWLKMKLSLYLLPVRKGKSNTAIMPNTFWMSRARILSWEKRNNEGADYEHHTANPWNRNSANKEGQHL